MARILTCPPPPPPLTFLLLPGGPCRRPRPRPPPPPPPHRSSARPLAAFSRLAVPAVSLPSSTLRATSPCSDPTVAPRGGGDLVLWPGSVRTAEAGRTAFWFGLRTARQLHTVYWRGF